MEIDEIKTRLTEIFRDVFSDNALVLTDALTADDVAKWDSLSHINLIYAVEKAFKIRFQTKEVRSMKNVGDLVEVIKKKAG